MLSTVQMPFVRGRKWKKKWVCLRYSRGFAEHCSAPALRYPLASGYAPCKGSESCTNGDPEGAAAPWSPFFAYFLWRSKESEWLPGHPRHTEPTRRENSISSNQQLIPTLAAPTTAAQTD
jgi:hypothetical protein